MFGSPDTMFHSFFYRISTICLTAFFLLFGLLLLLLLKNLLVKAGESSCLQDGMYGRRVTAIDRPPTIAQRASGSQDTDAWPSAEGLSTSPQLFSNPLLE
jgi:hypothetical protein